MDDLRRICATDRVFLRHEALAAGYDDKALRRSLKHGVIHRVRRGAYIFTDLWTPLDARGRHAVRAAAVRRQANADIVLSHVTAASLHGLPLWGIPLEGVHVTRRDQRSGRREAGVVQHKGHLAEEDVVIVDGVPVTSVARTVVDLALLLDFEHAVCVADAALASGACTAEELVALGERMKFAPGSLGLDLVLGFADGRSESVAESRTRVMLHRAGLPTPELQHEIRDADGRFVARVDFAWPELGVYLEFDGKMKYDQLLRPGETAADAVVREKLRERAIANATGWRVIRLVWADLEVPAVTCAMIRRTLANAA